MFQIFRKKAKRNYCFDTLAASSCFQHYSTLKKIIADRIFANLELNLNQQKIQSVYLDALFYGSIRNRAA